MPPRFSKHSRTDHSASADFTPRGYRSPRGQRPQHAPRGGRQERPDRRQPRDTRNYENRSRAIDDAFHAPLDSVQLNSLIFSQCIAQVLRKQSGIKTKEDHDSALADHYFEMASRHMSYRFRHTNLMHRDGSLSLHELLYHQGTARKIRSLYREGMKSLQIYDEDEISMRLRSRDNTIRFLMPLAHVICDSNKARAMIGYLSTDDFQPGITPVPDNWFKTADFDNDTAREAQANILEGVDIASIFIRFESGHSTDVEIQHCPFMPDMFSLRYLIHGTNEKNLESIRRLGLLPGGTRGGRNHVHFALDSALSTMKDVLRAESDCILIARPGAVAGLGPVITHSRYVLTDQTVPFTRFCGVWSFIDRAWLDTPEPAELRRMNDYTSDIDLAMHVCHHQLYWEKRNENEKDGISWTRSEYVEYVGEQILQIPVVTKFLESFQSTAPGPSRPLRTVVTPNDQERGPPETEEDKKVNALRDEISKRFKKHLDKAKNHEATSASESEAPKRKIQSKPMPKKQKSAAAAASSEQASGSTNTASAVDLQANSPWGSRRQVVKSRARREMNTQAKELFRDADAAQKFFTKFKKETEEIQWFPRPAGPQCCKNFAECNCAEAMFWCHPCGFAYCLECRTCGLACKQYCYIIILLNCPLNFCQIASAQPSRLSTSECWLTLFLLNLRISEPLEVNMHRPVRRIFKTLSRICVKADLWVIPTCRAMQGTVSSSSITLVLFTLCQMEFEFQLFKSTTLTPRIRRRFRFGDQKLILSTLTALTLIPKKFSVYWNSSDRVFSAKEQSKVLSSAPRITSMNSRETHISLAFWLWILVPSTVFRISEVAQNFQNGLELILIVEFCHAWYSAMRLILCVYVRLPTNTEELLFIVKLPRNMEWSVW